MRIMPFKYFWLGLSAALVIPSLIGIALFGFRLSADFSEGTLMSLHFTDAKRVVEQGTLRSAIASFQPPKGGESIQSFDLKQSKENTFILRTRRISHEESDSLSDQLKKSVGNFEVLEARDVSPIYAKTFRNQAFFAVIAASLMIIVYITYAFRKISRGIRSWKLGVSAVIALLHDVLIVLGVFVWLGYFYQVEIDALIITALLSVMGYSVHDTIVVFDRVRENVVHKKYNESFEDVAERSVQQTMARSINTSFATLLVLLPMLFLGATEIFYFILTLTLGIIVGTYSSIFVATPLLTIFQKSER